MALPMLPTGQEMQQPLPMLQQLLLPLIKVQVLFIVDIINP
jgi:hypothetical protein